LIPFWFASNVVKKVGMELIQAFGIGSLVFTQSQPKRKPWWRMCGIRRMVEKIGDSYGVEDFLFGKKLFLRSCGKL
jgi:hypothetical protein